MVADRGLVEQGWGGRVEVVLVRVGKEKLNRVRDDGWAGRGGDRSLEGRGRAREKQKTDLRG